MSEPVAEFRYSEARLAERLGISRGDMKFLRDRHLAADSDWKKIGGEVALSNGGLKAIWHELKTRPAALDLRECLTSTVRSKNGSTPPNEASEPTNGTILLGAPSMPIPAPMIVTRICENPYVVLAVQKADIGRQTQTVWVGKNNTFTVGMQIGAVPKKDTPGFWHYAGPLPTRRFPANEWNRRQAARLPA